MSSLFSNHDRNEANCPRVFSRAGSEIKLKVSDHTIGVVIERTDIELVGLALDLLRGGRETLAELVQFDVGNEVGDPLRVRQTLFPLLILLKNAH